MKSCLIFRYMAKSWLILVFVLGNFLHAADKEVIFPLPKALEPSVRFWEDVYAKYDTNQVILHDNQNLSVVYHILDLPKVPNELSARKYDKEVQNKKKQIAQILDNIYAQNNQGKKSELREIIEKVLEKNNLLDEPNLKDRLRAQSGLKSQFAKAIKISGRYIADMKAILKSQGLPMTLAAVPYVESLFTSNAMSHAGAGGFWGIMPATAKRLGITINNFVDERFDPFIATMAASQYLKKAKEEFKEWPLAITSYNYGFAGVARAINNLGTRDLEVIIAKHRSPIFGFACKNYYTEVLAASNIIENRQKYFTDIELDEPWNYEFVEVSRPVHVDDLEYFKVLGKDTLKNFNPSITSRTLHGKEAIPPKYSFRVPKGYAKSFYLNIKKIPDNKRQNAGDIISVKYKANGRKTLYKIADEHGFQVEYLLDRLGHKDANYKPKGILNLRTAGHRFSNLIELASNIK